MNTQRIQSALDALAALPGMTASALVDAQAGMVWHASGTTDGLEALAEAATDYWRLSTRLRKQFAALGELQSCAMLHTQGMMALMPCSDTMVVVAVAERGHADWQQWQRKVKELAALLAHT